MGALPEDWTLGLGLDWDAGRVYDFVMRDAAGHDEVDVLAGGLRRLTERR